MRGVAEVIGLSSAGCAPVELVETNADVVGTAVSPGATGLTRAGRAPVELVETSAGVARFVGG